MKIYQCILTQNDCYKRGLKITPKGIMVHSTGANNPNLCRYLAPDDGIIGRNAYNNHWNMSGVEKCVHAMIGLDVNDDVKIYQTLPWNHRAWHCGASGNDTHISFEILEDGLSNRAYFEQTRNAAIELCAYLCREFNLDPMKDGVLIDHREGWERGIASGHTDVRHWWSKFSYTMNDFRKAVKAKMAENDKIIEELVTKKINELLPSAVTKAANDAVLTAKTAIVTDAANAAVTAAKTAVKNEMAVVVPSIAATAAKEATGAVTNVLPNTVGTAVAAKFAEKLPELVKQIQNGLPKAEKVYHTYDELPKWAKDIMKPLIDAGVVKGVSISDLGLTETIIRMLVFMWRWLAPGGTNE